MIYTDVLKGPAGQRLREKLVYDTLQLEKMDLEGRKWSKENYRGGYTSYSSYSELHTGFSAFEELERKLQPHVQKFAKALHWDLRGKKLRMTTCWTSRMPRHTYHTLHIHPLSVLSGTFYVQVPQGTSRLKLEHPTLDLRMASPPRSSKAPREMRDYYHCEIEEGRFYLFESWMRHEVPPNPVEGDRISVSFNYECC
jgi:uncharacterized protein (TIGR02466 family)